MIKYVDNKGKLHMLVLLVFTLFSKKSTLYMGGLLLWGLPGGEKGDYFSPCCPLGAGERNGSSKEVQWLP